MRLTEAKIRYLSDRVVDLFKGRDEIVWTAAPEVVGSEVARVIRENLLQEEVLDADVEKVVRRYRREIESQKADILVLRQKIKKQLARERGIVL